MRKRRWKNVLAFVLALVMFVSVLPASYVYAGSVSENTEEVEGDRIGLTNEEESVDEETGEELTSEEESVDEKTGEELTSEEELVDEETEEGLTSEEESVDEETEEDLTSEEESMDEEIEDALSGEEINEEIATGQCGNNLTWTLDSAGTLKISGTGAMWDFGGEDDIPWEQYEFSIYRVVFEEGITKIGNNAFKDYNGLIGELILPESLLEIGNGAFENCVSLEGTLDLKNVASIGKRAFYNCFGFSGDLVLGNNVALIGEYAFSKCKGFDGNLVIGECLESIPNYAFKECNGLSGELIIPDNVMFIGNESFYDCSGFSGRIQIGNKVERIGTRAFYNCSNLIGDLSFPSSLGIISNFAFQNCTGLSGIAYIPKNVRMIGTDALQSITTIYGEKGSYAESYANANYISFVECKVSEEGDYFVNVYVETAEELIKIANNVSQGKNDYKDHIIHIKKDIDLTGKTWKTIGNASSRPFRGSINGNGFTISGLTCSGERCGLIDYWDVQKECFIKDITIDGMSLDGRYSGGIANKIVVEKDSKAVVNGCEVLGAIRGCSLKAGGLFGTIDIRENGLLEISNCDIDVTMDSWGEIGDSYSAVGGVSGTAYDNGSGKLVIQDCAISGNIVTKQYYGYCKCEAGGLIGVLGVKNVEIERCSKKDKLHCEAYYAYTGGFIGNADIDAITSLKINNCYVNGEILPVCINGTSQGGGIIGHTTGYGGWEISIYNTYVAGKMSAYMKAGFVCWHNSDGCPAIRNSYFDKDTLGIPAKNMVCNLSSFDTEWMSSNISNSGGFSTAEMKQKSTYAGWDFENIWTISADINNGYPTLKREEDSSGENQETEDKEIVSVGSTEVTIIREGENYNLLTESQYIGKNSQEKVSVYVKPDWGYAVPGKVVLVQDNKNILESEDGSFENIVPGELFAANSSIYIALIDADNEIVGRRKIRLIVETVSQSRLRMATQTKRLTVYRNENDITDKERDYVFAEGAIVTVEDWMGSYEYTVSKDGTVVIPYYQSNSVTISKEGYVPKIASFEQLEVSSSIYLQKKSDKAPVVSAVYFGDIDVLTNTYSTNVLSKNSVEVKAEVDWGKSAYDSVKLIQDSKSVALAEGESISIVLSDYFDITESIYIVAVDKDGRSVKIKLNIEDSATSKVVEMLDGVGVNFSDKINITLPQDFKPSFLAGTSISVGNLETLIPITVSANKGKIYVAFGVDLYGNGYRKDTEKNYETGEEWVDEKIVLKSFINDLKNIVKENDSGKIEDSKKLIDLKQKYKDAIETGKGYFAFEADFSVLGYAEAVYDENGSITWLDSKVIVEPSVSVRKMFPFVIPIIPIGINLPANFETSLIGKAEALLNIKLNDIARNFEPDGEIKGTIIASGKATAGLPEIAHVRGGLNATFASDWKIHLNEQDYFKLSAKLSAFAEGCLAGFKKMFTWDVIKDTVWIEYPNQKKIAQEYDATKDFGGLNMYDASGYRLVDLSYLEKGSSFNLRYEVSPSVEGDNLKNNIYRESEVKYINLQDGCKMIVWLDSKDSNANNICLYYSYFDGVSWTVPKMIYEDGTMDYMPCVVNDGSKVYVAWQNATQEFALSEELTAKDVASKFDISVGVFEKEYGFQIHTFDCANIDMNPDLYTDGINTYIVWVNNAANDWFGDNYKNSIIYSSYQGGVWVPPTIAYSDLYAVGEIVVDYNEELKIAYTLDMDGDLSTLEDIKIVENGNRISESDKMELNPFYLNHDLYWYCDGTILEKRNFQTTGNIYSEDFQLVNIQGNLAAVYVQGNGLYSSLVISYLNMETNKWSEPVALTDGDEWIGSYSASVVGESVEILYTSIEVIGDMDDEEVYGDATLKMVSTGTSCDLQLLDVYYQDDEFGNWSEMQLMLELKNNGRKKIDKTQVLIKNSGGSTLTSTILYDTIVPGETINAYVSLTTYFLSYSEDITVSVVPVDMLDANMGNNEIDIHMEYEDVCVEDITYGKSEIGETYITADIVNRGCSVQNNISVSLIKDTLDGEVVDTQNIEVINSLEVQPVSFQVDIEDHDVYFVVINDSGDKYQGNDSDFIIIRYTSDMEADTDIKLECEKQEYIVPIGDTCQIKTFYMPGERVANGLKWYSEDENVATVDNGIVTGVNIGTTTITASSGSQIVSCVINVTGREGEISIFKIPPQTYTGEVIKPEVKVYYGSTLLMEKIDYTISYSNNKKVASASDEKAPTVKVTGKGNYKGSDTQTFDIVKKDISTEEGIEIKFNNSYTYTKKKISIKPTVKYGNTTLKSGTNKDYIIKVTDIYGNDVTNKIVDRGNYKLYIIGVNNFEGQIIRDFNVNVKTPISKLSFSKMVNKPYTGQPIVQDIKIVDKRKKNYVLEEGKDYIVDYNNSNVEIGTVQVTITGKGDKYTGSKTLSFKITGTALSKAKIIGMPSSVVYTGESIQPELELYLNYGKKNQEQLMEDVDYTVVHGPNTDKGTGIVTLTGMGKYTGKITKKFTIKAANVKNAIVEKTPDAIVYSKGGSRPEDIILRYNNHLLVQNEDYSLSYANNNAITTEKIKKKPKVTVKGKGNYTGSINLEFEIITKDINDVAMFVSDVMYTGKSNRYKPAVTLTDVDGKVLRAGSDYEKNIRYVYTQETSVRDSSVKQKPIIIRAEGEEIVKTDIIPVGTILKAIVTPKGNYSGEPIAEIYRVTEYDIKNTTYKAIKKQYTGKPIELTKDDIELITKDKAKTIVDSSQYEIISESYKNNLKKGAATVIIRGIDGYGGTKTIKFSIEAKGIVWWFRELFD